MTAATGVAAGRMPALDGLRGVAVLLVLVLHFTMYGGGAPGSAADALFCRLAGVGWIGVDLFFVLSGFLITGILLDAGASLAAARSFYARRILRIFPLYYAALAVFLVVVPRLWPAHPGFASLAREGPWYWTYLANFRFAADGWPEFGPLGHFWSLAVEEQFYLLWPTVVWVAGRRRLPWVCAACFLAALAVRIGLSVAGEPVAAFVATPARMDGLALGGLLALAARDERVWRRLERWGAPAALVSGAGLALLFASRGGFSTEDPFVLTGGLSLLAVFFGAVLVAALAAPRGPALLGGGLLAAFGRYSYGLYVIHHPLVLLRPEWASSDALAALLGSALAGRVAFVAAGIAVSFALAWVSWHALERPFLSLKDHFPYRGRASVPAPTARLAPAAGAPRGPRLD